jgi:hypothetical protein
LGAAPRRLSRLDERLDSICNFPNAPMDQVFLAAFFLTGIRPHEKNKPASRIKI